MSTQTINATIIDLPEDGENFFHTPLSSRGSTKHDAISVENYDRERHLHLWFGSSQTTESPIPIIDLDQYSDEDEDLKILYSLSPIPKSLEKGESSSRRRSPSPATFDCEICVETKPIIESFGISGCSHTYCKNCVSKYIAAKLQDNILKIECLVSGCSGRLEPHQCRQILPGEVFDRWGDALCEAVVMRSKRFYCPYKDCSALVFLEESEEKMKESECPHCNRMVCVECGTKWHPEISCEEFQKLAENERERDDILLKKMAESNSWRRCPLCKFYIEKSQGCLYMKCRCGSFLLQLWNTI